MQAGSSSADDEEEDEDEDAQDDEEDDEQEEQPPSKKAKVLSPSPWLLHLIPDAAAIASPSRGNCHSAMLIAQSAWLWSPIAAYRTASTQPNLMLLNSLHQQCVCSHLDCSSTLSHAINAHGVTIHAHSIPLTSCRQCLSSLTWSDREPECMPE